MDVAACGKDDGALRRRQLNSAERGHVSESTSWSQVGRPLYLPQELMGFAEGTGLLWLAGMSNGVCFFAPPYWKIEQAAKRASRNPYYEG
jgi:hypothetical protein